MAMIVYDLKQFSLKLKMELEEDTSLETAQRIAQIIETATKPNGELLTAEEKGHVIKYFQFPIYDHKTGQATLMEADNSDFLKLVAIVAKNVKGEK